MPIILKHEEKNSIWAVWRVEESLDELLLLKPAQPYLKDLKQFSSNSRMLEWLITRILLFDLLQEHKEIAYQTSGKPYITDNSYKISISHTKGFVAIYLSSEYPVAIDIEHINNRIERVAFRVFSAEEFKFINKENKLAQLIIMWCAKETLFKAFDLKDVDFIEHLKIHPFRLDARSGKLIGQELQTKNQECLDISYLIKEDFIITYGQKKCPDEFTSTGHSK